VLDSKYNIQDSIEKIDIVIPWVDSTDPVWLKEKEKYSSEVTSKSDAREIRYRDWNNLKYVFRSIEKFAPWVNKVHFITFGHLPKWLNTQCPKIHIVRHEDFIPKKYLPVFSSHVIELNMHRIEGLSEKFIYFNDDIFLIRPVNPDNFFRNGLPCDCNVPTLISPHILTFSPIVFNSVSYINKHFNKRYSLKTHIKHWLNIKYGIIGLIRCLYFMPWKYYTGFYNHHLAVSYLKSTLIEVWEKEPEILAKTCGHRFRDHSDVNQYIFRYWQFASDKFEPCSPHGKQFTISSDNSEIIDYIKNRKGRMICINDGEFTGNYETVKREINEALDSILTEKSKFEK